MTAALVEQPIATPMSTPNSPEWEHRSELILAALPSAVGLARLLIRRSLADWSFDGDFAARAEQVVDELVVHAVATTGVVEQAPLYGDAFDHLQLLVVRLRVFSVRVMVEVWDRGDEPPHPRLSESRAIALAEDWGYDMPMPGKRVVWCAVATTPDRPEDALPRRVPRPVPRTNEAMTAESAHEPEFLRRVRDGLRQLGQDEAGGR